MRTLDQEKLNRIEKYIIDYQRENGQTPSYRNIMRELSMSSLNLVQKYVLALEKQGKIERNKLGGINRSLNFAAEDPLWFRLSARLPAVSRALRLRT